MSQQPIHVVVEKKGGCLSGCGTALAVMLLLGLTIQYWYVALPIVAIVALAAISNARTQRKKAALKPGPRDPWLNEVAVALADLGLKEIARNTRGQLGGAPIDGDIGLEGERFVVYVTLFSDQRLAQQAELGLRAKPEVRDAIAKGATAVKPASGSSSSLTGAGRSSTSSASTRSLASWSGWRSRHRCCRRRLPQARAPHRRTQMSSSSCESSVSYGKPAS
jgi:hypothetical protein